MKESKPLELPDLHFIQERIMRILSFHEDGISAESLANRVAQTMPPEFSGHMRELRQYVKQVLFDLKLSGGVEAKWNSISLPREEEPSLYLAASLGNIKMLEKILTEEEIPQDKKTAALISSVINNRAAAVKILIEAEADVNIKDCLFNKTAMQYVTKRTSEAIIQMLRNAGAVDSPELD